MLIQFKTDNSMTFEGFKASFHYVPIEQNCPQLLKSPDSPTIDCSWVITAPSTDSSFTINFETFEVKINLISKLCIDLFEQKLLKLFSLGILKLI